MRIFSNSEGQSIYAFVLYESPDFAAKAKNELHQKLFNNRPLYVNYYEVKEKRRLDIEDQLDKIDYQNFLKSQMP